MIARSHETQPKTTTVDTLRSAFHSDQIRSIEISDMAYNMQRQLGEYFDTNILLEPQPLTTDIFNNTYDPSLPTIAVDAEYSFSGSALLGLASHEESTRANVIYLPTTTNSGSIRKSSETGEAYLEISSGALVLPSGQITYGEFPTPVIANIFETSDLSLIRQCEECSVPLSYSLTDMRRFNDKELLTSHGPSIHTPRRIAKTVFSSLEKTDNLVIKPSKHAQGKGVLLTGEGSDTTHTKHFYQFLDKRGYEPIVEERIKSREITDPNTGERLDWNVRAILSYGDLIDMYVRADTWGKPVNMSVSARAISMREFPKYFTSPEDAQKVIQQLDDAAQALAAEHPASFIGADLTVDETMRTYLFEINMGNTGGLQTIAKLEDTYDDKLYMTREILRKLMAHAPPKVNHVGKEKTVAVPLTPSLNALTFRAYGSELHSLLTKLDLTSIPDNDEERSGIVLALAAIRSSTYRHLIDPDSAEAAGARLQQHYPIELHAQLPLIYDSSFLTLPLRDFLPHLDEYSELFGDDPEALTLRARLAANEFDLQPYKATYQQMTKQFEASAQYLYHRSAHEFMERFRLLANKANKEDSQTFRRILGNAVTAYCEYGYDTADKIIYRNLEKSGSCNQLSQLLNALRFYVAYGDERYENARQYFYACEQDFETPWSFYEYIIEEQIPRSPSFLARQSDERFLFITEIRARAANPMIALTDAVEHLRQGNVSAETQLATIHLLTELVPLESTDNERRQFAEILARLTNAQHARRNTSTLLPDLPSASTYTKYALFVERTFAGDRETAARIADQLEDIVPSDHLDYLLAAYTIDPDE